MWAESDAAELLATLNFTVTLRRLQVRSGPAGVVQSLVIFREMVAQRISWSDAPLPPPPLCAQVRLPGHTVAWCDIIGGSGTAEGFNKQTGMLLLFFPFSSVKTLPVLSHTSCSDVLIPDFSSRLLLKHVT